MVAPRKTRRVVCTVIRVPADNDTETLNEERPSQRLPWWDPAIARLVTELQDEVRLERRRANLAARIGQMPVADLDPPSPSSESEWDWRDEPRWTWPHDFA